MHRKSMEIYMVRPHVPCFCIKVKQEENPRYNPHVAQDPFLKDARPPSVTGTFVELSIGCPGWAPVVQTHQRRGQNTNKQQTFWIIPLEKKQIITKNEELSKSQNTTWNLTTFSNIYTTRPPQPGPCPAKRLGTPGDAELDPVEAGTPSSRFGLREAPGLKAFGVWKALKALRCTKKYYFKRPVRRKTVGKPGKKVGKRHLMKLWRNASIKWRNNT